MLHLTQVFAIRGTPQAIVANLVKPCRQYMLEKTPNEFLVADGHDLHLSCVGAPISEGDLAVVDRDDPAVGDGDTVNVATEILQDGTGTMDSRFTVNDPVFLP